MGTTMSTALATPAPIVLFTYNRLEHTRATVTALEQNHGANESLLYIYSDAPKTDEAKPAVMAVRDYLHTVSGFKAVHIIEREINWGLADSIVDGVSTIVAEHGRVIVLEDDIVTAPDFLTYMNEALTIYAEVPEVMHVSGYYFPITDLEAATLPPYFFYNQTSCWGWGTWARAWQHYRHDAIALLEDINSSGRKREFDMNGCFRFSSTLRANAEGRQKTWAIKWHASVFLQKGLCLHPRYSLTKNIGHDGSGTHGQPDSRYHDSHFGTASSPPLTHIELTENLTARTIATRFLAQLRPSFIERLRNYLRL